MNDSTWKSDETPIIAPPHGAQWLRVAWRGALLTLMITCGLILLLLIRLVEKPLHGVARPWSPHVTVAVCRTALRIMGIRYNVDGHRMSQPGAVVANHSSWLDIFALNAGERVYFVSKAEVAKWPGIGLLARATGTVFINRDRREAAAQKDLFEARLEAGHKLLFFPEGTSTDGRRVLPFKPTLFAAFFSDRLRDLMWVQPVTVTYRAPTDADPSFFGWWGDMDFASHLVSILAHGRHGRIDVTWHDPVRVADFADRKSLARAMEDKVRSAHTGVSDADDQAS